MPVPKPTPNESKNEFIKRCIDKLTKEDPNRTSNQIQAICFQEWRNRNKRKGIFIEN